MHQSIIHDLTPQEAIAAHEAGKARAEQQLADATTFADREVALCWLSHFTTNILKWQRIAERSTSR